ncbi:MAG TPA: glycosyltransferase [Patescibacteria group bacterium]
MAINPYALSSLKVALVHDPLTVPAGAEKVLYEFHKIFPHAPIYTPLYRPEKFPEYRDVRVVTSSLNRFRFARNHHQLMIPLLPYFVEQLDLSEYDLILSDSSSVAKGVITRPESIHICYCQTPMRWAWMPQLDPRASSSLIRRLAAHYLRLWDSATVDRVDVWLANAKTSAARVKKFYKRDAAVIYPPVDIENVAVSTENDDYYLSVGRLVEQKRIDLIVEAAKKTGSKVKIVGGGPLLEKLKSQAKRHKNISFLGRVSDQERDELYAHCKAFIFASEEDAGIVPIEAMAYGKPVIAFGRGGASETVLDKKTGLHFAEQTADSLALAIEEFETLHFDAEYIGKHAQQFSSARFRQEITAFIQKTVESR